MKVIRLRASVDRYLRTQTCGFVMLTQAQITVCIKNDNWLHEFEITKQNRKVCQKTKEIARILLNKNAKIFRLTIETIPF